MGSCKHTTDYLARLAVAERAQAGESDQAIAAAVGWSVWTVRKWRRRYAQQGAAGLRSVMGRPPTGILSSYPAEVREHLLSLRRTHPGWGAAVLLDQLQQDWPGQSLPSRARVAALLAAQRLTRRYERHGGVVPVQRTPPTQAHQVWQLDAQGPQSVAELGQVCLINIVDEFSRLKVESYPYLGGKPDGRDYQLLLRRAFLHYGLPEQLSLDHDSAFYDNTCRSPFPTRLHLWLVALGVAVSFIRTRRPTDHALIERQHQTLSAYALVGQTWPSQTALWQGLEQARTAFNERVPCARWAGRPPLAAYPAAACARREYRPEWEAELLDLARVYQLLATGRWFRQTNCQGEFWLGRQRYNVGRPYAKTWLEIHFEPTSGELIIYEGGADYVARFPANGLTKPTLMGDLATVAQTNYQPMLPISHQAWRELETYQTLIGTTL